ncbi:DUF4382 domain-containing protein [Caldimonas brevitalea]|nr:DUF4382 domain-containing protein [Caldimonas brevitalea]
MRKLFKIGRLGAVATSALLAACGGGGSGTGSSGSTADREGTMRLALTDAPACGYDEVNVSIERVEVHLSDSAPEGDQGWEKIVLSPAKRVNLLDLTNGALEELGSADLPAGTYRQIRLVLAANSPGNPFANSVVPTGGEEVALDTPSAQQSGLKLKAQMDVAAGETADYVLDFDACKSVVRRGNSGRYNLKPVLSLLPGATGTTGLAVHGYVSAGLAPTASVSLQQEGVVARATVPDAQGKFVLSPVPAGNYDLVITAEGRVTAVMTGVPVSQASLTTVNPSTAPIDPPVSGSRTVSGTVTSGTTGVDATLRALQTVGGTQIELAGVPADADTGAYSFTLATGAPVKAAYSATATALTFAPDAAAAGKYTVEALVTGKAPQTAAVDVSAANANATASFTFAP